MDMQREQVELTPEKLNQALTQMKKQANQIDGEAIALRNEATLQIFQNVANMLNQVFSQKVQAEKKVKDLEETLEKIYQGHPDIKISLEADAKEAREAVSRKTAKKVK